MSILFKLVSLQIKNAFGLSVLRDTFVNRRKDLWKQLLMLLVVAFGFISIAVVFTQFTNALVVAGSMYGQPEIVFTISILATQLLLLITGIFLVISTLYFADDLSILVPLPLKPSHILISKLSVAVVTEYLTSLFFLLPAIIAYTRLLGGNVWYFLSLLLVFLALPVLPIVLSSFVSLGFMKVINRRHRDLLTVVGSLLMVFLSLGLNYYMQSTLGNDPNDLQQILTSRYGLIQSIGHRFPPSIWATKAIAQAGTAEGWLNLGLFLLMTILSVLLLLPLAEKLFYSGLIGGGEVSRKRKQLSSKEWERKTNQQSVFKALFLREWKIFLRTPVFAMNGFLGALIAPLAMLMPMLAQGRGALDELKTLTTVQPGSTIATLIIAGFIVFLGSVNTISSTSISREGKLFYISKMIPVAAETQARAKLAHAFVGAIISLIPVSAAYAIILQPSLLDFFAAVLIGLTGSLLGMAVGLYVDMRWPRLNWSNPQQAVKQNFNALIPMLLEMGVLAGAGYLSYKMLLADMHPYYIYAALLALLTVPGVLAYLLAIRAANRLYYERDL